MSAATALPWVLRRAEAIRARRSLDALAGLDRDEGLAVLDEVALERGAVAVEAVAGAMRSEVEP